MKTLKLKIILSLVIMLATLVRPNLALADICSNTTSSGQVDQSLVNKCVTSTPIWKDIEMIVNVMSAGVGVVVTGVIILGGVQYTMAGGNAQSLQAARKRITNGLIALFIFIFTYAFLQWLIPGGVFNA